MQKYLSFIMYYGNALLLCTNILTDQCMSGHRTLLVYKLSDLYLLRFLRYRDSNQRTRMTTTKIIREIMFVVQFSPTFMCTYILTLAIMLRCQKWIIIESKSVNPKLKCTGIMGQDLVYPYIQSTIILCDIPWCSMLCRGSIPGTVGLNHNGWSPGFV